MKWSVEQQPFRSNIEPKLNPAGQDHQSSAMEDVRFVVMQISVGCYKFLLEILYDLWSPGFPSSHRAFLVSGQNFLGGPLYTLLHTLSMSYCQYDVHCYDKFLLSSRSKKSKLS